MKELVEELQSWFIKNGMTLSTAESCTGGNIAHEITKISGSSNYFLGSVVSYANTVKQNVLKVSVSDIAKWGVVSEPVARQMAVGVQEIIGSSYSISTTGVAGPAGGAEENPVGTVWIGIAGPGFQVVEKYVFEGNRLSIIKKATKQALISLRAVCK